MARLNTNAEVFHRLTEVGVVDDVSGGGSSTLAASAAVNAGSISVTASTNFAVNDKIRIARKEYNQITAISGAGPYTFTLKRNLEYAHASGAAVVEVADVPIGEVSSEGVMFDSQTEETPLKVGTQRGVYLYMPGGTDQSFKFSMANFSLENLAETFGLNPATYITGAGTSGNPYILTLNTANFASQPERCWYFIGLREDAMIIRAEFWQAKVYAAQTQVKVTTGEPTLLPINLRTVGIIKIFMNS